MSKLFAPFVLIAHLLTPASTPYSQLVDHVSQSIVRITHSEKIYLPGSIEMGEAVCTGEMIAPQIVLTANHCVVDRASPIYVDGMVGKVVKADEYIDLALLSVPFTKPSLDPSPTPVQRGQILVALGYAEGKTRLTTFPVQALYVLLGIIVHPAYIGGMSGGPIVDESGLMVGIIQKGGRGLGMGADVEMIRQFLVE